MKAAVARAKKGPRIDYVVLTAPPGLWLKQATARVGRLPGSTRSRSSSGTRNNTVRSLYDPASRVRTSKDSCGRILTRSRTPKIRSRSSRPGQCVRREGQEARAHGRGQRTLGLRRHQGGVAHRIRSQGAAGPSVDRVGDLQPARGEHAAPDRLHDHLRARGSREPRPAPERSGPYRARTTRISTRAFRRLRSGRSATPRCVRRSRRADRRTCTTCSPARTATHTFTETYDEHLRTSSSRTGRPPRLPMTHRSDESRRSHR